MNPPKFHITATFNGPYSFYECLLFIEHGIRALGYEVTYAHNQLRPDAINIVLGSYSELSHINSWTQLRKDASHIIIYNWEQVAIDVPWFTPKYFRQMVNAHVWDYHHKHIAALQQAGVSDVHHVPLAFVPQMQNVIPISPSEQDIDVLFYGLMNERRVRAIEALREKGLRVITPTEAGWMHGTARDKLMARSKIVLNMHFFDVAKIFEIARVSYPLSNKKCVVSEIAENTDIDDDIRNAVVGGTINELPQLCWDLVHDDARRHKMEQRGFEAFSKRSAAASLKPAIDRYLAQLKSHGNHFGNPPNHSTALPRTIQIGAGAQWNFTYCNIDTQADLAPDLNVDIGNPIEFDAPLQSWRFGQTRLTRDYFDKIIAKNVFQRVSNLRAALTNCLHLLRDGGEVELVVPLDLSLDAWQSADTKRAFNENTFQSIINDWWQYGWTTHRFEIVHTGMGMHNPHGMTVLTDNGGDWQAALNQPRAIDSQTIVLRKRALTDDELTELPQTRFLD